MTTVSTLILHALVNLVHYRYVGLPFAHNDMNNIYYIMARFVSLLYMCANVSTCVFKQGNVHAVTESTSTLPVTTSVSELIGSIAQQAAKV